MIERELRSMIREAVDRAVDSDDLPEVGIPVFDLTRPDRREHGDWSSNVALVLQKAARRKPREVADAIAKHLPARDWVRQVEVAGPGFVNFFLSNQWLHDSCARALAEGSRFGSTDEGAGASVNVEFVSANPTGPLHIGTARNAALGDAIARLLEFTGYKVTREYYYNDAGRQMELFGVSVAARYLELCGKEVDFPDDGYRGEYVYELAGTIHEQDGDRHADRPLAELAPLMRERTYPVMLSWIEGTLERFGVHFDVWFSERELYETGRVNETIERLSESGLVERQEGAVWLRSGELGDTRDRRVLVKSDGSFTYLAGDLAYHADKASRGFERMIVVLGADHHGQVPSLHAGMKALGVEPERIEVVLYQLVRLLRAGEPVSMGRRAGDFVALEELLDEVGTAAARYTLLQTSAEHDIRFDIEEVKKQSLENPVYYVQYAHARIASILRHAEEEGVAQRDDVVWDELTHEAEIELMRAVAEFEETVSVAAHQRAPYRITRYAEDLARRFHRFYTDCRVLTTDEALTSARLGLSRATKQVLANALTLLGVSAPQRMEREPEE